MIDIPIRVNFSFLYKFITRIYFFVIFIFDSSDDLANTMLRDSTNFMDKQVRLFCQMEG